MLTQQVRNNVLNYFYHVVCENQLSSLQYDKAQLERGRCYYHKEE